jgi:hypothetical protein
LISLLAEVSLAEVSHQVWVHACILGFFAEFFCSSAELTCPAQLGCLCRLQLLSALLPVLGMAGKAGSEGFQLDAVMGFVGAAFGNSNAEVRAAAVQLTLQVGRLRANS